MVLTWEAIAALARAVIHRTVTEDGVVHAGLVALKIRKSSEGLVAAGSVAGKGLAWSEILLVTEGTWSESTGVRATEDLLGGGRRFRTRVLAHVHCWIASNTRNLLWNIPADAIASATGRARQAGSHGRGLVHLEVFERKLFDLHWRRVHVR